MAVSVLMVAEKPSIAESLAKALSRGKYTSRKGVSPAVQVHEFNGTFQGHAAFVKITSCAGHVYTTDFPSQYQSWDRTEPITLFGAEVVKIEANPKTRLPAHFKAESKGITHLVLWLDCDREGENICFEVIQNVKSNLPNPRNIWRAKFSSLAPNDLHKAYDNLGYPNENESLSVDARQEIDLKIGVAFTRFQTRFFQGKYGDLDSSLISYGPCQTPTLYFCVKRHQEIQSFQPEPFYTMNVGVRYESSSNSTYSTILYPDWLRGRLFDQRAVICFKERIAERSGGKAIITSVKKSEESRTRPQALDTVSLLKMASQYLGIGPHHCMHIAERLYLQGFITYPRTETSRYPPSFDLRYTLQAQASSAYWGGEVRDLLDSPVKKPRTDGKDVGDHPPITPIRSANESDFDHDSWRVYELVTRHFIATVSNDCRFEKLKIGLNIGGEDFELVGRRMIEPGFTKVSLISGSSQDVNLPSGIKSGDILSLESISVNSGKTKPPPYLSESDLLSLMEKNGIGTDASMATHINNICERNFVTLAAGRRLVPTKLGILLVNGYQSIDPELVTPKVRSDIEGQCSLIAQGRAKSDDVVSHALSMFTQKFEYFLTHISKMDALFESSFTSLAQTGKPLSRCGKCKKFMNLIDKKPVRLFCRHCDEAYGLPSAGTVKLYKELMCPLDGFELVLISHPGSGGKTYPVCPMCYNNPPFEGVGSLMNCHECPHATCKHSMKSLGICGCSQSGCKGTLCLDPDSKPKWRVDCNKCNFQVKLFKDESKPVHKLSVLGEKCEECESTFLVQVEYHKEKNEESFIGCIVCDEELNGGAVATFSRTGRMWGKGKGKGRKGGRRGKNIDPRMTFDQF
jgi:DNA topoisomerase III